MNIPTTLVDHSTARHEDEENHQCRRIYTKSTAMFRKYTPEGRQLQQERRNGRRATEHVCSRRNLGGEKRLALARVHIESKEKEIRTQIISTKRFHTSLRKNES
eukprot:comp19688_c0_seq1/m.23375 comp19688_c0_seq1/g.23375  ORF comp19688_c0_seq1/g.23375 comp19688_c0_seq1/m.23375 type:complete len:104 (+) comp19688_c0_seq1:259-570(+)